MSKRKILHQKYAVVMVPLYYDRLNNHCLLRLTMLWLMLHFSFFCQVPEGVVSAGCPDCTGEIKRIDATGKCHSCFPCPECIEGYSTSSVPCGSTIPYERDIHCVEIQQHPQKSSQTIHSIFVSGTVTSASQISATTANLVISATSSFIPASSSTILNRESMSTKDPNTDNISPSFDSYSKNTTVYILCAVSLVILSVAIVFKLQKKNKGRSQSEETTADAPPSLPGPSLSGQSEQGDEACHIDLGTNHVVYRGAHSSEMGDKSLNTVSALTHGTEKNGSGNYFQTYC